MYTPLTPVTYTKSFNKNNNNYNENIGIFSGDNSRSMERKKNNAINSVKNIKNEVIVKRNEIIEKIQHCQNLLNTIMIDKKKVMNNMKRNINNNNKRFDNINNNQISFNKNSSISDFNSIFPPKRNNGMLQAYTKNSINISSSNPNQRVADKYTYKRINVKYLDKSNDIYSFDNISKDNTFNSISFPENNYLNNNKNNINNNKYYKKQFINKNYLDREVNLNNYSFDVPKKRINKIQAKSEYSNYPSTYMNINNPTRKRTDNQIYNYNYNINSNDTFGNNIYKSKIINDINKKPMFKKIKGY